MYGDGGDVVVFFEARIHFMYGQVASFLSAHTAARSPSGVATRVAVCLCIFDK